MVLYAVLALWQIGTVIGFVEGEKEFLKVGQTGSLYLMGVVVGFYALTVVTFKDNLILSQRDVIVETLGVAFVEAVYQSVYLVLFDDASHWIAHRNGLPDYLSLDGTYKLTLT